MLRVAMLLSLLMCPLCVRAEDAAPRRNGADDPPEVEVEVELDDDKDGMGEVNDRDDDNDGVEDEVEIEHGTNPRDAFSKDGGTGDNDLDGITDDKDDDDDNDGVKDNDEVAVGTNPRDPASRPGGSGDLDGDSQSDDVDDDDDNDNVPDHLEKEIGTSAFDAKSSPFGVTGGSGRGALQITRAQVKRDFKHASNDSLSLTGKLPLATPALSGQRVIMDVGGVVEIFTLDSRGMSRTSAGTLKVAKPKNGQAAFSIKLAKRDFGHHLDDEGLTEREVKGEDRTLNVAVLVQRQTFETARPVRYDAKLGRTGTAR